ncbi:MAG: peptide/nickel transport system permease protein [Verrucomicrobiota bacterium]|nr:peptide/nickel transport system permease protein [Verrucomicrobiota bacterium]
MVISSLKLGSWWTSLPRLVRIVVTRLLVFVPQLVGALAVTFALIRLLPGDPALTLLGNLATPEAIASLRERLGLDRGILEQFIKYAVNVAHGDLGMSILTANPVTTDLMDRAPATFELLFYALVSTVIFGILLAVLGVLRPGRVLDRAGQGYGMLAGAIPDFWVALLLIYFFFHCLGWAPAPFGRLDTFVTAPPRFTGFYTVDSLIRGDWQAFFSAASRLALPVLTLTIVNAGGVMKMTRSVLEENYRSGHVAHARACGLSERTIMLSALRNSLPPLITQIGFLTGFLLGGAVLVETIFSWNGLGQYAVQSVVRSDYAALQGFVLLASVFILVVYLVVDVLYEMVDPRIQV